MKGDIGYWYGPRWNWLQIKDIVEDSKIHYVRGDSKKLKRYRGSLIEMNWDWLPPEFTE